MHRKMTRLARAGKCVARGASAPAVPRVGASRAADSWARPAKARYPNPDANDFSAARRVAEGAGRRPPGCRVFMSEGFPSLSIDVPELGGRQQGLAVGGETLATRGVVIAARAGPVEERRGQRGLVGVGGTAVAEEEGLL